MVLSYGKHRGKDLQSVPREYLDWLLGSSRETVAAVEAELQRRDLVEMADSSWAERIVRAGFRALALRHHPDQGGDSTEMREILAANEQLNEVLSLLDRKPAGQRESPRRTSNAA